MLLYRQVGQELPHVLRAEIVGMAQLVEVNEASNPAYVGLFRSAAQVLEADVLPHLVEKFGLRHQKTWFFGDGVDILRFGARRPSSNMQVPGRLHKDDIRITRGCYPDLVCIIIG